MLDRALANIGQYFSIERLLIQLGLDPGNITYDAVFNRLTELLLASITFSNVFALVGGIFLIATFVVRTIVPMRVLTIVSIVFFLGSAALAGSVPRFFLYLLALPINVIRLVQIRNLVKKARSSAQGTMSLDWLRPYMTPRTYHKGDVLFRKGDPAAEMFLTVIGNVSGNRNQYRNSARAHPWRAWISVSGQSPHAVGRMHRGRRGAGDFLR